MVRNEHNTRGKINPNGHGHITNKGHRRIWNTDEKRFVMEHRYIWEKHFGEIPKGMQIHHIDENKLNNNISNLKLVSSLEHKRIHSGCYIKNSIWYKPCRRCGKHLELENNYYKRKIGISSWCKKCSIQNAVENKRRKNENNKRAI